MTSEVRGLIVMGIIIFLSSPFSLPSQTVHKRQSSVRHFTSITKTGRMGTTKSSYDGEDSKSTDTPCLMRSPGSQRFFTHLSTPWVHFNFVWISTPQSSKLFPMRYHELSLACWKKPWTIAKRMKMFVERSQLWRYSSTVSSSLMGSARLCRDTPALWGLKRTAGQQKREGLMKLMLDS